MPCSSRVGLTLALAVALLVPACTSVSSEPFEPQETQDVLTGEASADSAASESADTSAVSEPAAEALPQERRVKRYAVARVVDGDTIELKNGERVRLVQIDSPELGSECFSEEASAILSAILPRGAKVRLEADPQLDKVDRYGRLLRYVFKGRKNVNLAVVNRGAASVWFFQGDKGRYAQQLMRAAKKAKAAKRGLWGACPGTKLNPSGGCRDGLPTAGGACGDRTSRRAVAELSSVVHRRVS